LLELDALTEISEEQILIAIWLWHSPER